MKSKSLNVLFIGDIFGKSGLEKVANELKQIKEKYKIHFVIAQAENVSGRKGMSIQDFNELKKIGVNAFTLGNHVWAKKEIYEIINSKEIIRPLNINEHYPGHGTSVFDIDGIKLRVTSLMGITFNPLHSPWQEHQANNFFDAIDKIIEKDNSDYHIIDFHAETTSEKSVLGLYLDGKVSAVLGTHTHIQTNDAKILPNNTIYITDVGMTGPANAAIGANYKEVYEKMRYDSKEPFKTSNNKPQFNAVVLRLSKKLKPKIITINTI